MLSIMRKKFWFCTWKLHNLHCHTYTQKRSRMEFAIYYIKNQRVFFLENNKWACPLITEARCEQSCYTNNLICSFERKIKMKKQLESSKLQSFTSKSMSMINLNSNLIWHWYVNISTRKFGLKVISILEACFDLISSPSPSMKIQVMGGKIIGNLGFKSLYQKIFFSFFCSFSNSP